MLDYNLIYENLIDVSKKCMPLPIIHFETNIVNHCNLNCAYCDHLSPIADEWYADLTAYEQDIKRMAFLFNGEARYIRLVGGEPLLHPDIVEIINITRNYFKNTNIEIWTNGILLNEMSESFWRTCSLKKATVQITKYPININYCEIEKKAKNYKVKLSYFGDGSITRKFNNNSFDICGTQDPRISFLKCQNANRHITLLQGGDLFTCDKVSHVKVSNKKLGGLFNVLENDYINIYSDVSAKEIFNFLARPIPFCRYCNIEKRNQEVDWKRSALNLEEWVICNDCFIPD